MAELSYPTSGGGSVTDTKYEQLIGQYGPSGLVGDYNASQKLVYADSTGRQIKIRANRAAIVRGFRWETDSAGLTVPIAANSSGQLRYDRVVLRLDRSTWTVSLVVIQGQPSASPSNPDYYQQEGPTGYWDLRLARVAVASGAVTIAAGDVQHQAFHIGGWATRGERGWPPATAGYGNFYYSYDASRMYTTIDNQYRIIGESGNITSQGAGASGWDTKWIYYTRWNGFVYMHGYPLRSGGNLSAGTDSNICTIPSVYRPPNDIFLVAYAGNAAMQCHITASTGLLRLLGYGIGFNTGAALTIHPVTWPANNV